MVALDVSIHISANNNSNNDINGIGHSIPDEKGLTIRLVFLSLVLAVYSIFTVATTAIMIYRYARKNDTILAQISVPLVVAQALAGLCAGVLGLVSTMLYRYPCALKLWAIYVGVLMWLATVVARASQRCSVNRSEKRALLKPGQSLVTIDMLVGNQDVIDAEAEAIEACFAHVGRDTDRPNTRGTLNTWSGFASDHAAASMASLPCIRESLHTAALHRSRSARFVATRPLVWILAALAVALALFAGIVNAKSPQFSQPRLEHAAQHVCYEDGWEMWPAYGLAIFCTGVAFPALAFGLWSMADPYTTRADLLICIVSAQVATVLFVIWEAALTSIRGYVSELFIVWLNSAVTHAASVCWPLWRSIKHQNQLLEAKESHGGFGNAFKGSRLRHSIYTSLYKDFHQMIDDRERWAAFLIFATKYYRSAIPAFLSDFQRLKYKTIEVLRHNYHQQRQGPQHRCSSCCQNRCGQGISVAPATADAAVTRCKDSASGRLLSHLEITRSPLQAVVDAQCTYDDHPLSSVVPVSKGILESAMLLLPPNAIDKSTVFPEDVKSVFSTFTCMYFTKRSHMSINIPDDIIEDVQKAIESNSVVLSVLDRAKDEVLFLLCTDVYAGYCKRLEMQSTS
ncbi:hypothetical protein J3B02_002169 [Coemansia erecta]|nr:hypothetical protein J3B02_002169 [Coemansia erecta]